MILIPSDAVSCRDSPCANNAICEERDFEIFCNCIGTGYQGSICTRDINECAIQDFCGNGTCENTNGSFECSCIDGYIGDRCEIVTQVEDNAFFLGYSYTAVMVLGFGIITSAALFLMAFMISQHRQMMVHYDNKVLAAIRQKSQLAQMSPLVNKRPSLYSIASVNAEAPTYNMNLPTYDIRAVKSSTSVASDYYYYEIGGIQEPQTEPGAVTAKNDNYYEIEAIQQHQIKPDAVTAKNDNYYEIEPKQQPQIKPDAATAKTNNYYEIGAIKQPQIKPDAATAKTNNYYKIEAM